MDGNNLPFLGNEYKIYESYENQMKAYVALFDKLYSARIASNKGEVEYVSNTYFEIDTLMEEYKIESLYEFQTSNIIREKAILDILNRNIKEMLHMIETDRYFFLPGYENIRYEDFDYQTTNWTDRLNKIEGILASLVHLKIITKKTQILLVIEYVTFAALNLNIAQDGFIPKNLEEFFLDYVMRNHIILHNDPLFKNSDSSSVFKMLFMNVIFGSATNVLVMRYNADFNINDYDMDYEPIFNKGPLFGEELTLFDKIWDARSVKNTILKSRMSNMPAIVSGYIHKFIKPYLRGHAPSYTQEYYNTMAIFLNNAKSDPYYKQAERQFISTINLSEKKEYYRQFNLEMQKELSKESKNVTNINKSTIKKFIIKAHKNPSFIKALTSIQKQYCRRLNKIKRFELIKTFKKEERLKNIMRTTSLNKQNSTRKTVIRLRKRMLNELTEYMGELEIK